MIIKLLMIIVFLGALSIPASSFFNGDDIVDAKIEMIYSSLQGQWEGEFFAYKEGKTIVAQMPYQVNYYVARNDKILISESGPISEPMDNESFTHDVSVYDPTENKLHISFNNTKYSKPIVHIYELSGIDKDDLENDWSFTREQTGLVSGSIIDQRETVSYKDGSYTFSSKSRSGNSSEPYVLTYIIKAEKIE
ncbi:hypothetical protein [Kordiimonas aquimaris]|uniref:hypothetical protein n=1 Tax=Kordiimonas aquimaris TaxID=707591 RepID=UPI0021D2E4A2|nr:hypothetical protein [Kordiimonas aquimaris]